MRLSAGGKAPEFAQLDQNGSLLQLSDFRGKKVVLYFYPKDMTSGCTIEACQFRDLSEEFKKSNAVVIGVSPDSEESHQQFIGKHSLSFSLISDTDRRVCSAYGAWGKKKFMGKEYDGVRRTTFIIGENGKIEKIFENVKAEGHARQVLEFLNGSKKTR